MKNKAQIIKGSLELAVLGLFMKKKKLYGYEIILWLKMPENKSIYVNEGTVYPMLSRFEKSGFLRGWWKKGTGKRKIHVYAITEKGKRSFEERKAIWLEVDESVRRVVQSGKIKIPNPKGSSK